MHFKIKACTLQKSVNSSQLHLEVNLILEIEITTHYESCVKYTLQIHSDCVLSRKSFESEDMKLIQDLCQQVHLLSLSGPRLHQQQDVVNITQWCYLDKREAFTVFISPSHYHQKQDLFTLSSNSHSSHNLHGEAFFFYFLLNDVTR